MKERIIKFKRGPFPKKYTAIIKNSKTKQHIETFISGK